MKGFSLKRNRRIVSDEVLLRIVPAPHDPKLPPKIL
ncbi:hypothetical protein VDGL01_10969 [Verticillium dahliae]